MHHLFSGSACVRPFAFHLPPAATTIAMIATKTLCSRVSVLGQLLSAPALGRTVRACGVHTQAVALDHVTAPSASSSFSTSSFAVSGRMSVCFSSCFVAFSGFVPSFVSPSPRSLGSYAFLSSRSYPILLLPLFAVWMRRYSHLASRWSPHAARSRIRRCHPAASSFALHHEASSSTETNLNYAYPN